MVKHGFLATEGGEGAHRVLPRAALGALLLTYRGEHL
jgi:hypothetical protein